jgi:hypothetical protein
MFLRFMCFKIFFKNVSCWYRKDEKMISNFTYTRYEKLKNKKIKYHIKKYYLSLKIYSLVQSRIVSNISIIFYHPLIVKINFIKFWFDLTYIIFKHNLHRSFTHLFTLKIHLKFEYQHNSKNKNRILIIINNIYYFKIYVQYSSQFKYTIQFFIF